MKYTEGIKEPDGTSGGGNANWTPAVRKAYERKVRRNIISGGEYSSRIDAQRLARDITNRRDGF